MYYSITSAGIQAFPEYVVYSVVDGVNLGYCDSNTKKAEFKYDWMKKLNEDHPEHSEWHNQACRTRIKQQKILLDSFNEGFNQSEGMYNYCLVLH